MEVTGASLSTAEAKPAPESGNATLRILARNGVVDWTSIREGVLDKLADMSEGDKGIVKDIRFSTGTLLHKLVGSGNVDKDTKYISSLADIVGIDTKNSLGQTALHTAIFQVKPEMVQALTKSGADKEATIELADRINSMMRSEKSAQIVAILKPTEGATAE